MSHHHRGHRPQDYVRRAGVRDAVRSFHPLDGVPNAKPTTPPPAKGGAGSLIVLILGAYIVLMLISALAEHLIDR